MTQRSYKLEAERFVQVLAGFGFLSDLRDHTYYAVLRIRHEGELVEIDARPSDAIAVAVTCDPPLPIYVNEDVLNDVLGEQE